MCSGDHSLHVDTKFSCSLLSLCRLSDAIVVQESLNMRHAAATSVLQSMLPKNPSYKGFGILSTPMPQEIMPKGVPCRAGIRSHLSSMHD